MTESADRAVSWSLGDVSDAFLARRLDPSLLALAALAVVVPIAYVSASFDEAVMPRLAATLVLAGLAALFTARRSLDALSIRMGGLPAAALGALLVVTLAATVTGVDPFGSLLGEWQRYQGLLPLLTYATIAALAALVTARHGSPVPLLLAIFLGTLLGAGFAILESLGLDWMEWYSRAPSRQGGLYRQPNVLAVHLITGGIASAGLLYVRPPWCRYVVAAGLGLIGAAIVLTYSRGGWVGAALGVAFTLALVPPWRLKDLFRPAAAGVAVLLLTLAATGSEVATSTVNRTGSVGNMEEQSARFALWGNAFNMVLDNPILGAGPDAFSVLFPSYRELGQPVVESRNIRPESSHSALFDQLVGVGIVGTIVWLAFVMLTGLAGIREVRRHAFGPDRFLRAGIVGALAAYFTAVMFSYTEAMTGWLPWMLIGALAGITMRKPAQAGEREGSRGQSLIFMGLRGWGGLLLVGGVVLGAADLQAGKAEDLALQGSFTSAAARAQRAHDLNPIEPRYLFELGAYELEAASSRTDTIMYRRAAIHFHKTNQRFAPTAASLWAEAAALVFANPTGAGDARARLLLKQAEELDPYNEPIGQRIADLRRVIGP